MMAFLLPVLIGGLGLGFEISNWYLRTRAMQNAADAAAIAAASNGGSNYDVEAKAVTAQYGFVDGSNNVTVAVSNTAPCPTGGTTCYSVQITSLVPIFLSQVIGYNGDTELDGNREKTLSSTAIAERTDAPTKICLLALGTTGQAVRSNGSPNTDFTGCNIMSNSQATCNGWNLKADFGLAHGTNNGCGNTEMSDIPIVTDPYAALATNIPPNTCSTYPQEPSHIHDPPLPGSNLWSGTVNLSGNGVGNGMVCGDLKLTGNVVIHTPDNKTGATLVIENGQLDTNGYTLSTDDGSALTIVFSGTNGGSYKHYPTGGGKLDLTTGIDISDAGNMPTWAISGLTYFPNASVTFSGAVNKSSFGASCFVMVVHDVLINGTGSILETGGCDAAGLAMPATTIPSRGQLVY
jgi:Flp pilus assembly protein TadG